MEYRYRKFPNLTFLAVWLEPKDHAGISNAIQRKKNDSSSFRAELLGFLDATFLTITNPPERGIWRKYEWELQRAYMQGINPDDVSGSFLSSWRRISFWL